jgi:NitT/TauT family transport system substrate-binding protein
MNKTTKLSAWLLSSLILLLAACQSQSEAVTLKMAVLPIMDALPMYVAQEQGYFAAENVNVEFVPVTAAPDRDQLIKAGQADGMINEVMSTMFYNEAEPEVVIVRFARHAMPDYPHFYILASGQSGITSLDELKGQEIGISEGTIIEYTTDRLLERSGFSPEEINTVAVPRIPDRLALLGSGELAAGNMPDPAAALAVQQGGRIIIDDSSYPEYGHSVITFRQEVVDAHPEAIEAFLRAIETAVNDINSNKAKWTPLLSDKQLVPAPILENYIVPDYPTASVPSQAQWDDALAWAKAKGYINSDVAYESSVDASFLP